MSVRGDAWRARALTAVGRFRASDTGQAGAHGYAYMAAACGRLYGWDHTWTRAYLQTVYNLQNPDGGWGLSRPYDAFQDGSINPPDTTYTVSVAGHVGPVLLEAWKAGAPLVPRARVQATIDLLMSVPRVEVERGQAVAYSVAPVDTVSVVHNVSAGVAAYMHFANEAGFGATGMQRLITDITIHQLIAYREADTWWPYLDDGDLQDADHNSYSAESMYRLAYWVGREVAYQQMAIAHTDNGMAPIAHMRLASLPGGPGSWSRTQPGVTLWAQMGDQWWAELDAWIAAPPNPPLVRWAQAAFYCSRAWMVTR